MSPYQYMVLQLIRQYSCQQLNTIYFTTPYNMLNNKLLKFMKHVSTEF